MSILNQLLTGCLAVFILINIIFALAKFIKNFAIIDIFWGFSFGILSMLYFFTGEGDYTRKFLLTILTSIWAIRLGLYLLIRIIHNHPNEDKRYKQLTMKWGKKKNIYMFCFYHFQGFLIMLLSPIFALPTWNNDIVISTTEYIGILIIIIAILGESISDYQLFKHKNSKSSHEVFQDGLWKYSRHPNYFFQWLAWVGFFVYVINSNGIWTIYCPLLMLLLITKVTGIKNNEMHNLSSKGKQYLNYQKSTSCFIPLPRSSIPRQND